MRTPMPVFPTELVGDDMGLTKRELFAAMAMQGWLASFGADAEITPTGKVQVAELAVELSDALLAALEKKP
jgi:hypothetical protein